MRPAVVDHMLQADLQMFEQRTAILRIAVEGGRCIQNLKVAGFLDVGSRTGNQPQRVIPESASDIVVSLLGQRLILMIASPVAELGRSDIQNPFPRPFRDLVHKAQQILAGIAESHTPLRLVGNIPDMQDKERLKPWLMQLVNATDQPVEGNVECILQRKGDDSQHRIQLPAGKQTVPQELATLPSGIYQVKATAVVGGDTAVWEDEDEFTLFSMYDSHLAEEEALYLYCPRDTFDIGRPAEVRIGTSLPETWIHALLISDTGITMDTVVHVSDTAFVWQIPYRPEYNQGAMLFIANYSDGLPYRLSQRFHLCQPDMKLRPHWDTFRDRLRPGEHEEWRLSLRRPDGSPARANVLLSLYDKSLDAILPHDLGMNIYRPYRIPSIQTGAYRRSYNDITLTIIGQYQKERPFELSVFNPKYFTVPLNIPAREYAGATQRVYKTMSRAAAPAVVQKFNAKEVESLAFESVD